jgi:hypothetical protein
LNDASSGEQPFGRPPYDWAMSQSRGGYVVLKRVRADDWRVLGEVDRQPGLPARRSRAQAIRDVLGREPTPQEVFAVLPRSEWRLSLDH